MTAYDQAGVDQAAADALIPTYAAEAARTRRRPDHIGVGGFAGGFSLAEVMDRGYAEPMLALSTDTTGTKIELLREAGRHRTAGWDCVAMNVDDVICVGAEPLVFVDCIATERLDPSEAAEIVAGVADGCVAAGCELVGGETAQLPGLLTPGAYEVMGTCVGVVDAGQAWGPHLVRAGDAVVGLASSGLHSNGYSLVRKVLADAGAAPTEEMLTPTAIYTKPVLALKALDVHAAAHVTGGGLLDNLARAVPDGLGARVDQTSWSRPVVFDTLGELGVSEEDMRATFNLGVGFVVVSPDPDGVTATLAAHGVVSWVIGEINDEAGVSFQS